MTAILIDTFCYFLFCVCLAVWLEAACHALEMFDDMLTERRRVH